MVSAHAVAARWHGERPLAAAVAGQRLCLLELSPRHRQARSDAVGWYINQALCRESNAARTQSEALEHGIRLMLLLLLLLLATTLLGLLREWWRHTQTSGDYQHTVHERSTEQAVDGTAKQ